MNAIPRVVFDTNILFSAVGWLGNPHQCVQAARQGLAELAEKLQLKRGLDAQKATEITDEIRAFSKVITIPGTLSQNPLINRGLKCDDLWQQPPATVQ